MGLAAYRALTSTPSRRGGENLWTHLHLDTRTAVSGARCANLSGFLKRPRLAFQRPIDILAGDGLRGEGDGVVGLSTGVR